MLKAQMKDLNEDCINILRPYLIYFSRNMTSKSVTVGPGRFSIILKVLELFEATHV